MFAVVKTGGKQYRVEPGMVLDVERLFDSSGKLILEGEKGSLDDVLFVSDGGAVKIGQPNVKGASVEIVVLGEELGPKVISFKKLKRQGKQWKRGHRQQFSRIRIEKIVM